MTDESKDETAAGDRPKRPPPTIDLEASEVTADTGTAPDTDAAPGREAASEAGPSGRALSWLVAAFSGLVAALAVLTALWVGGLLGRVDSVQQTAVTPAPVSPAQLDKVVADVEGLKTQLARVEAAAPAANDAALAKRVEALEASAAALRDELARASTQLRNVTSSLNELKSASRDAASATDSGPLNERLTQLEQSITRLAAELARPSAAVTDDAAVRRLVVANTLDAAVRAGEPFAAALAAAKQVASDPAALAPLDAFAAKGIPPAATYLREIVPVLQRLADAGKSRETGTPAMEKSGAGVFERLQAGLANLVRIERDDAKPASDSSPSPAALATAVRRDDLAAARQDVAGLPQAGDPQIQAWIRSVDAREAALAASAKFSAEALAALGKSGQ